MLLGLLAVGCATSRQPGHGGSGSRKRAAAAHSVVRLVPQLVVASVDDTRTFCKSAFGAHGEPLTIGDSVLLLIGEDRASGRKTPQALAATVASLDIYVPVAETALHRARKFSARTLFLVEHRFWGDRYGQVLGPSGHKWGLASRVENLTSAAVSRRAQQAFDAAARKGSIRFEPSTTPVTAVPAEHNNIVIHLTVGGVDEAASYYEATFGARLLAKLPGPDGTTIQARMMFGETLVLLDEELPQMKLLSPKSAGGTSMILIVESKAAPEKRDLIDPFGHHWHLGTR